MIKLIYSTELKSSQAGQTIKRMNIRLKDYSPQFNSWDQVDYEPFKKWLCDKYHFVYEAVDWRLC